jgi:hypothetical protein
MASVPTGARFRQSLAAACGQCEHVIKFAIRQQPQSEVIAEPWNRSITRRSKSSLSAPLSASPAGSAITAPFDLTQHIVSYTIIWTISPQNAVRSGECGLKALDFVNSQKTICA